MTKVYAHCDLNSFEHRHQIAQPQTGVSWYSHATVTIKDSGKRFSIPHVHAYNTGGSAQCALSSTGGACPSAGAEEEGGLCMN